MREETKKEWISSIRRVSGFFAAFVIPIWECTKIYDFFKLTDSPKWANADLSPAIKLASQITTAASPSFGETIFFLAAGFLLLVVVGGSVSWGTRVVGAGLFLHGIHTAILFHLLAPVYKNEAGMFNAGTAALIVVSLKVVIITLLIIGGCRWIFAKD